MATVVIDPGHYGLYNPGVCPGYFEGNTMLRLAQHLGTALTAMGANVRYTRTTNEQNPSLAERGAMAAGSDLFISLHSDATDDPSVRGVTSFYSVRRPNSEPFAVAIGEAAAGAMGNQFRGAIARPSETTPGLDYLGVLRAAVATGVPNAFLIEHGFHTNPEDCAVLSDDNALKRIADAEARVIAEYLGLSLPGNICTFYYVVQPGEYLYLIGKKFGVPWQNIAAINNLRAPYTLMPNQRILIPMPMA
jgi:N-acetylmuramoyl-L-alanine amidase